MKGLFMTAIILFVIMSILPVQQVGSHYDSGKKGFTTSSGDQVRKFTKGYRNIPTGKHLEEPVGALSQAGNIILPALKMFQ